MKPLMKPKMKRSGVKFMSACWYEKRLYPTIYITIESPAEKIRRAIAHLTQVREELMCNEVRDFFDGSYKSDPAFADADRSRLVASNAGMLRLNLQMHLRKLGMPEKLKSESLAGIAESLEKAGLT